MKRMLKAVGGVALVMALVCLVATSVQARTFYSFNFGFGGYYPYCGSAYYSSGYCCYPYLSEFELVKGTIIYFTPFYLTSNILALFTFRSCLTSGTATT